MAQIRKDDRVIERGLDARLVAHPQLHDLSCAVVDVRPAIVQYGHGHRPLQLAGPLALSSHGPEGDTR